MKVKELPEKAILGDYKLKIPSEGIEQLGDPITEGWFISFHAKPGGWFMSPDPPSSGSRTLIPTYGDNSSILEWEIIEESKSTEDGKS